MLGLPQVSLRLFFKAEVFLTPEFVGHKVQPELRRRQVDNPPVPTTLAFNAATIAVFMRALRAQ